jgi:hypothetical protein
MTLQFESQNSRAESRLNNLAVVLPAIDVPAGVDVP